MIAARRKLAPNCSFDLQGGSGSEARPRSCRAMREGGFVIVAVLWMLASLATLVIIFSLYVGSSAALVTTDTDRVKTNAAATAAIELFNHQLMAVNEKVRPGNGQMSFRVGGAQVAVSYASEAARIDLNMATKPFLIQLMLSLGEAPERAIENAERIVGWRTPLRPSADPAEDPETILYSNLGVPYPPRRAPFQDVDELRLVYGMRPDLVERMLPLVTVYNGKAAISIRDASPQVLAALPRMDPTRLQSILEARANPDIDPRLLVSLASPDNDLVTVEAARAMRLAMNVVLDNGRLSRFETVVLMAAGGGEPYRVLFWRDKIEEAETVVPKRPEPK